MYKLYTEDILTWAQAYKDNSFLWISASTILWHGEQ